MSHLSKTLIMAPRGLFYYDHAVPENLQHAVAEWFHSDEVQKELFPVTNTQGKSSLNARRVLHYGWVYNYSSKSTREPAPPFPRTIERIRSIIPEVWKETPKSFDLDSLNQCIVNRYLPGQGIGAHIDSRSYGDTVVCFTFEGSREMEFSRSGETYCVRTTPGSMYVMTGESRYDWKHQMRPRISDAVGGKRQPRSPCFSVTFRGVV